MTKTDTLPIFGPLTKCNVEDEGDITFIIVGNTLSSDDKPAYTLVSEDCIEVGKWLWLFDVEHKKLENKIIVGGDLYYPDYLEDKIPAIFYQRNPDTFFYQKHTNSFHRRTRLVSEKSPEPILSRFADFAATKFDKRTNKTLE